VLNRMETANLHATSHIQDRYATVKKNFVNIIKIFLIAIIFVGCSSSKGQMTDICLNVRGIPSKVSQIRTIETTNKTIGTIKGFIRNRIDSIPNTDAIITSKDFPDEVGYYSADENGFFEFQIEEGEYELIISSLGTDDLKKKVSVMNGQAVEIEIYIGIGNSWTDFSTKNPRKLKKKIRKQNRERKRKYGG